MTLGIMFLLVLALGALVLRRRDAPQPGKVEASEMQPEQLTGPEAREWLKANRERGMFAGNRFDEIKDALDFVDRLYGLGAVRVIIPKDSIDDHPDRITQCGGPGADALVVFLPTDVAARKQLLAVASHESEEEGFDPVVDEGQDHVFMWWD